MSLDRCFNIGDLRKKAKRRLPAPIFHYIDGGADDEVTLRRNTAAFDDYELVPDYLVDVSKIDTRTTLLGIDLDWPLFCSPTAMSKLFHHDAEPAVARAARRMGTMYSLSTLGTTSIEDIAAVNDGPKLFQVYVFKDRGLTREFVARCKAAKFHALALTVDVPVAGNRERDHVTGMILPPEFRWKSLLSYALHPDWSLNALRDPSFEIANVRMSKGSGLQGTVSLIGYLNQQIERSITWKDAEWLAQEWGGPLIVKGVHSARDAKRAAEAGAKAVMISNHGGRQLDGVAGCIDVLPSVMDTVGDRIEVILDGGVRRGTHILKALALGAKACSTGRGYLYGLAAGGEAGVMRALSLLKTELERDMALLGCPSIADLKPHHVARRRSELSHR